MSGGHSENGESYAVALETISFAYCILSRPGQVLFLSAHVLRYISTDDEDITTLLLNWEGRRRGGRKSPTRTQGGREISAKPMKNVYRGDKDDCRYVFLSVLANGSRTLV